MTFPSLKRAVALAAAGLAVALASVPAAANTSYSKVVSFGDSLSDTGNLLQVTTVLSGIFPALFPAPLPQAGDYFNGRFSNGRVAVEVLADGLKGTLNDGQSLALENYAYGGAQTGQNGNLPNTGMLAQLDLYKKSLQPGVGADAQALYFVWGGGNDLRSLVSNPSQANAVIGGALTNLASIVTELYGLGARNFLLPNLPDIGLTPEVLQLVQATNNPLYGVLATQASETFNGLLAANVVAPLSALPGIHLMTVDTMQMQRSIIAAPAAYGLTNVTEGCFAGYVGEPSATPKCATPDSYFNWDKVHPTARVHAILGNQMIAAAVPEPATMLMMASGALALLSLGRRRRQA